MASLADGRTHSLFVSAMLLAAALILSYVETLLPPLGMFKLGLANIAVTLTVFLVSRPAALAVSLCRVAITSLLFGSVTSFLFSLFGAVLAWTVTSLLKAVYQNGKMSLIGISMLSAAAHNVGQIIAACLVLYSTAPVYMLWWLLLAAIPTGALTGLLCEVIYTRIRTARTTH